MLQLPRSRVLSANSRRWLSAAGALLLIGGGSVCSQCRRSPAAGTAGPVDPQLTAARRQFRLQQDARMRGELSPLSRVDYTHLPVGEHTVGTNPGATVRLEARPGSSPQGLGEIKLLVTGDVGARRLTLRATPAIARNGVPEIDATLRSGDVLAVDRWRLLVVGLPKDPAVAVYDPSAQPRRDYAGLIYFPDDERFVTRGRLARYPSTRAVQVDSSRGDPQTLQALGLLHFSLSGQALSMEAYSEGPGSDRLFLIFKDQTNDEPSGSYGAGRFLTAQLLATDEVVLDFNQAWNPLCAYSHYFHCPLPPRTNWLALPIAAGERAYPAH